MEKVLFRRIVKYFAQARHTRCANGELINIPGNNGLTEAMKKTLKGIIPESIDIKTKEVLTELKQIKKNTFVLHFLQRYDQRIHKLERDNSHFAQ
jgi:TnpA family transposase